MLKLQIQGGLQLGVEDHLASSLLTGESRPSGLFPTPFPSRLHQPNVSLPQRFTSFAITVAIEVPVTLGQELLSATPGVNVLAAVLTSTA